MLWLAGVPILIEYPLRIVVSPFFKPVEWERGCWQRARIHTHVLRLRGRQQRHVSSDRLPVSAVSPLAHATVGQVLLLNIVHWDAPFWVYRPLPEAALLGVLAICVACLLTVRTQDRLQAA
jgi:hypothetical protein